jgi:hypothetical protein
VLAPLDALGELLLPLQAAARTIALASAKALRLMSPPPFDRRPEFGIPDP